ncbi:hypothetical protein EVAR_52859_1 [Eumeta japonica]|uniref:Uncharacterized protein n=1 Tax=Eumeta variegata TaxID=151549 RepID=A0A4C1YDA6_EUMVA|nr:hypothetical protein EVAR_52859_1 [Eumeta japonica]
MEMNYDPIILKGEYRNIKINPRAKPEPIDHEAMRNSADVETADENGSTFEYDGKEGVALPRANIRCAGRSLSVIISALLRWCDRARRGARKGAQMPIIPVICESARPLKILDVSEQVLSDKMPTSRCNRLNGDRKNDESWIVCAYSSLEGHRTCGIKRGQSRALIGGGAHSPHDTALVHPSPLMAQSKYSE